MIDATINEKLVSGKKSEIGFTVSNIAILFKYLFPATGPISISGQYTFLSINKLYGRAKLTKLYLTLI